MTELGLSFLCAFLISLHIASSSPPSDHELQVAQHGEHVAHLTEFMCHEPQPRVFTAEELFPDSSQSRAFFPDVTVLHRCDASTGVCPTSGDRCHATRHTKVDLIFKVTFLENDGHHRPGQWEMQSFQFLNHTSCGCAPPRPHTAKDMCQDLHVNCKALANTCSSLRTTCRDFTFELDKHHYMEHVHQQLEHDVNPHTPMEQSSTSM